MLKLVVLFLVVLLLIGFGMLGIVLRGLFGAFYWLRGKGARGSRADGERMRRAFGARFRRKTGDEAERMRACAFCGVHVPESEGVRAAGEFFCCDEHRRAHGKAGGK
ncbi:MAG: hypothetical protein LBP86_07335 [Azoarcus sp.]|nr:hypothetical protein [Azoarcus sp.]